MSFMIFKPKLVLNKPSAKIDYEWVYDEMIG